MCLKYRVQRIVNGKYFNLHITHGEREWLLLRVMTARRYRFLLIDNFSAQRVALCEFASFPKFADWKQDSVAEYLDFMYQNNSIPKEICEPTDDYIALMYKLVAAGIVSTRTAHRVLSLVGRYLDPNLKPPHIS